MHYLTKFDDATQSGFWVIPKITSPNLCKPIHGIINYSTSICPFESGRESKGKKYKNLNILRTKRTFSMKQKAFFIVFEGLLFGEKIKNSAFIMEHLLCTSCMQLTRLYH